MMDSSNWLLALLNTGAFLLCVGFLVYVIVIMRPYLSIKELPPGDASDNDWHLIVPALNEEEVIGGTVLHLTSTFPQAHVWVINDGSDDDTGRILAELATRLPKLHVITRVAPDARTGKGDVLNLLVLDRRVGHPQRRRQEAHHCRRRGRGRPPRPARVRRHLRRGDVR